MGHENAARPTFRGVCWLVPRKILLWPIWHVHGRPCWLRFVAGRNLLTAFDWVNVLYASDVERVVCEVCRIIAVVSYLGVCVPIIARVRLRKRSIHYVRA